MTVTGPISRALSALVAALEAHRLDYMVIGGLGVFARGVPRLTRVVDVTVALGPARAADLAAALEPGFRPLTSDPVGFARETHVLPFEDGEGTRVDANFAVLPYQEEAIRRATRERIGDVEAKVATTEDLILHKLAADRPLDREDVRALVRATGPRLDRPRLDGQVRALAQALERPEVERFYGSLFAPS